MTITAKNTILTLKQSHMINSSSGATPTSSSSRNNNAMLSPSSRRNVSPNSLAKTPANNNNNSISSSDYESIRGRYMNGYINNTNIPSIPGGTYTY